MRRGVRVETTVPVALAAVLILAGTTGIAHSTPSPATAEPATAASSSLAAEPPARPGAAIALSADRADQQAAVAEVYEAWKSAFVRNDCRDEWYQVYSPDAYQPYVAEGQGYGMVITAQMADVDPEAQEIFDGILRYALDHPSALDPDLMAGAQDLSCTTTGGQDSATDGDMDIAYGLLLADAAWGSDGAVDYHGLAVTRINAIKRSEVHPVTNLMELGDWAHPDWTPQLYWGSRTSDWMLDHFRVFREATGDADWDTIRLAHQDLIETLQDDYAPDTGLLPDFVQDTGTDPKPAQGQFLESDTDGYFSWNACRTPWRIGLDALNSGDPRSVAAAQRLDDWIQRSTGGDPDQIGTGYRLDGTRYRTGSDAAFFAPFAVAALSNPDSQAWLDALWSKILATDVDPQRYYAASIQLQVMLILTGTGRTL
ncbi:endo-1,4-beta-D-glucanase Y [Actinoalloteichus hoggarensis]|uniref:Endoglucanase n=1 Tax=Actinoalloteichus hoggarensis TaxID=1470176 RepID=A0A221W1C8_9PSEU|nr:glycosyl hydrolase family 8 [Actinoalloteichus hoggarensis]ASO19572.1 Endoglucanase precursor [Actinoalloteichus hoggarensis]MBB5919721.1 endo-1,4-beta-D-glucanase Y [Actinoalloteichus hoggarensis]